MNRYIEKVDLKSRNVMELIFLLNSQITAETSFEEMAKILQKYQTL